VVTFRKSKKVGPLRLTVTPRGVSTSAGVGGVRVSANSKGEVRRTVGIPGTGVYDTKKINPKGGKGSAGPSQAEVDRHFDAMAANLFLDLSPEDQGKAYAMFRDDPEQAMRQMAHDLEAAGLRPEDVEALLPAIRRYMDRWMAQ
jgi:hypothetical protein